MSAAARAVLPERVLLTGGSRGIGRAIANALMAEGVRLALVGRDVDALRAVTAGDDRHAVIAADLSDPTSVQGLTERAGDALDGLDAFVSAAGIAIYEPAGRVSEAALARQLQVNFIAPFAMGQAAAERMAGSGGGSLLFIASTLATHPAPMTAAYAASKAALIAAARSLALELGPRGVRVNTIAPGVVDTDMVRAPRPTGAAADARAIAAQLEGLRALHPLGRLGQPEDVAQTALYLLQARYVTGAVVVVDGGLTLGAGRP